MIAIPDVKPTITGLGIKLTSFPTFKRPKSKRSTPDRNPAANTQEKAEKAVTAYAALSDVERTGGMIAVFDGAESVQSAYTPIDEFDGVELTA